MKLKRLSAWSSALVLSVSSLLIVAFPGVAHALGTTLYWCNASGGDFNTASNWDTNSSCSGGTQEVPANGYDLVFDEVDITANRTINDDISGLSVDSITFQNSSGHMGYYYTITGDPITVTANGITDNNEGDTINDTIILGANQTFGGNDTLTLDGVVQLSTYNLTITNSGITFGDDLTGSGSLTLNPGNANSLSLSIASPSFSGPVSVSSGSIYLSNVSALGSGTITVANGATVSYDLTASTATIANNFVLSGVGTSAGAYNQGAINSCLADVASCAENSNTNLTLSGTVVLGASTELGGGGATSYTQDITLTGAITYNGFTLTADPGSGATLVFPSVSTGSGSSSGSSPTTKTTPKTPDTGQALPTSHAELPLIGGIMMAGGLLIVSRKFRRPAITKRS